MVNPVEPTPTSGNRQVLIAELDPTGSHLLFSHNHRIHKGLDSTVPAGLAVDSVGTIYLAGNDAGPELSHDSRRIPTGHRQQPFLLPRLR